MKKNKQTSVFLKVGILLFTVYAVYSLISLQLQVSAKRSELDGLNQAIEEQKLANAEIEDIINNKDDPEYIAKIARDKLGYITPGERVFVNITN